MSFSARARADSTWWTNDLMNRGGWSRPPLRVWQRQSLDLPLTCAVGRSTSVHLRLLTAPPQDHESHQPPVDHAHQQPVGDLGRLPGLSLIGLEPPSSVTGDTHLRFGRLVLLSPINSTHLISIPQRSSRGWVGGWIHSVPRACRRICLTHDARGHFGLETVYSLTVCYTSLYSY